MGSRRGERGAESGVTDGPRVWVKEGNKSVRQLRDFLRLGLEYFYSHR